MHNFLSRSPKRYAVMRCKVLEFLHCTMQGHSLQQVPQQPPQVKHQSPLLRGGLSCTLIWRQEETWRSCGASHTWLWEWLRWELDRSLCCKYEVFFRFFVVAVSTCCECLSYEAMNSHYHTICCFFFFWRFPSVLCKMVKLQTNFVEDDLVVFHALFINRYSTSCCHLLTAQHSQKLITAFGQTYFCQPVG